MSPTSLKSATRLSALILLFALTGGFDMVQADQPGGGYDMHGHGKCIHGGARSGGSLIYGEDWRESLSDEQKNQLDRLHVAYAKTKMPLKVRMQALQLELTVLATATTPDKEATNAKIDALLEIKREALRAKYAYIAAQRQLLTPDQQISFDMQMIHKAMHGKRGKGGHH